MTDIQVKSHSRRKPAPTPAYIATHRQLREEVEAMKQANSIRDSEDWKRGPNALLLIAGKLKVLAARLVQ